MGPGGGKLGFGGKADYGWLAGPTSERVQNPPSELQRTFSATCAWLPGSGQVNLGGEVRQFPPWMCVGGLEDWWSLFVGSRELFLGGEGELYVTSPPSLGHATGV